MKQKFTIGERRGLIALLVVIALTIGAVVWQRHPAPLPPTEPTTVSATGTDTAKAHAPRRPRRSSSGYDKKPARRPKSTAVRSHATVTGVERDIRGESLD